MIVTWCQTTHFLVRVRRGEGDLPAKLLAWQESCPLNANLINRTCNHWQLGLLHELDCSVWVARDE